MRARRSVHGPEGHLACLGTTGVGLDQDACPRTAAGRGERRRLFLWAALLGSAHEQDKEGRYSSEQNPWTLQEHEPSEHARSAVCQRAN